MINCFIFIKTKYIRIIKYKKKVYFFLAGMLLATPYTHKANAYDYESPNAPQVSTPFSNMSSDTYDGYPIFKLSYDNGDFHYRSQGIVVNGKYNTRTDTLIYTVEEDGSEVTRNVNLSASGYRMIHGVNESENLFVVRYRN